MAFPAIAALVAAEAVTATMVLAAVAEVGMALTVVGAVTGNKSLMKIGGAMSLIGGVGGMMAGAASGGAAAAGAAKGAAAAGAAEAAAGAAGEAGVTLGSDAFGYGVAEGMGGGASLDGLAAGGADLAAGASQGIVGSGMNPTDMRLAAGTQTSPGAAMRSEMGAGPSVTDVATPAGAQAPAGVEEVANPYTNPTDMRLADGTQTTPLTAPEGSGSFFGKIGTWVEKNPKLFSSGLQIAGGAMKGANEREMWDQKMANERQALALRSHGNEVARFQPRSIFQGARA